MIGIYKITNPKGEVYIGQSINIRNRIWSHKSLACKDQPKLYNSLVGFGVKNHTYEIICECEIQDLNHFERFYQDFYNVLETGLNEHLTATNDLPYVASKENIQRRSEAKKGILNPNFGKVYTEEERRSRSEKLKGVAKHSDSHKEWMRSIRQKGDNPNSKIIIDKNTGVFYYSVTDLAELTPFSASYWYKYMRNSKKQNNKTGIRYEYC